MKNRIMSIERIHASYIRIIKGYASVLPAEEAAFLYAILTKEDEEGYIRYIPVFCDAPIAVEGRYYGIYLNEDNMVCWFRYQ